MRGITVGALCVLGFFLFSGPVQAATFCVSNETELLSALHDAAVNGADDVIQIVQGTYTGGFVYSSDNSSDLTIQGGYTASCASRVADAANTVLDGGSTQRVLGLVSTATGAKANFSIDAVTIQNGQTSGTSDGAGLYVDTTRGDVNLTHSIIQNNSSARYAGGVYIKDHSTLGDVSISGNTLANNTFTHGGGALYIAYGEHITISGNTITGNSGGTDGGGIWLSSSSNISITDNKISGNEASSTGGAIHLYGPKENVTVTDNNISNNSDGGGLYIVPWNGDVVQINGNNIIGNSGRSGGIYIAGNLFQTSIINNVVCKNSTSANQGGGLYIKAHGQLTLTNNTISQNSAVENGAGLSVEYSANDSQALIHSNIIWGNSASGDGRDIYVNNDANNDLVYSLVELLNNDFDQSATGFFIADPTFYTRIDPSNLNNVDPSFVNAAGDDFHLSDSSACINAGNNQAPEIPPTDRDGQPRIMDGSVDMGAYEFPGAVLPVALFSATPLIGPAPLEVSFHDESTGIVTTRQWDFGDNDTSSDQHPVHTYTDSGTYTVSLTVTGPNGTTTETKDNYITVQLAPPVAAAGPDRAVAFNQFTFDGSTSQDPDGNIAAYQWALHYRDDPTFNQTAIGVNPTVAGLHNGFYDVTLTVTDDDGLTGTDTMVLAVTVPWDINADGKTGLEEAIYILQEVAGFR